MQGQQPPQSPSSEPADPSRQLAEAEQLLACFQQVVGHDLPNQLIALQGLIRVLELEEAERLSADGRGYLQRLRSIAHRAHSRISALAEIGRERRDKPPEETLALASVAVEAAAATNQLYPDRKIEYHFALQDYGIIASRPALHRVFAQLLRNAVEAGREEGPVHIEVGARGAVSGLEFWVADRGRGISPEVLGALREFFSGRAVTAPGNGLGLVLVRQLVGRWGGSVSVDSEQGQSCVVTISLPPQRTVSGMQ
jgi:signal transduction histidine kinase